MLYTILLLSSLPYQMWRKEEQQRLEQVENVKSRAEELEAEKERLVRNQIVCREINSPSNNQLQYIIYTEMKLLILKLPDLQDFLNAPYTTLSLPRMMSATLRMERRSAEVEACSESFSNARSDCVKIQVPAYHYVQSNLPMPSRFRISSIRRIGYIYITLLHPLLLKYHSLFHSLIHSKAFKPSSMKLLLKALTLER